MVTWKSLVFMSARIFPYLIIKRCMTDAREMTTKMRKARPSRFFPNKFAEYDGTNISSLDFESLKTEILNKSKLCATKHPKNVTDGGLYVGSSGIGYMFYHMSKSPTFADDKDNLLKQSHDILNENIKQISTTKRTDASDVCGFLLGNSGIYAVAAAVSNALGLKEEAEKYIVSYKSAASICNSPSYAKFGGDELFVGRAGYICGALWLNKEFKEKVIPDKILEDACSLIVESGKKHSISHRSKAPLMFSYHGTEYLGAAHGLCTILQMLLSCDSFLSKNPDAESYIKQSVDYLLSLQTDNGNFPCALDELGDNAREEQNELVHWCHGAPGTVYLMAKAYLRWKHQKYLDSALKCGEVTWQKGLLKKGPGICHGVAGSGYVFLILYRLTGDDKHLYRANEFAKFMLNDAHFLEEARTPDSPYSLYEGSAGTVCYLTDLLNPTSAVFPFLDIF